MALRDSRWWDPALEGGLPDSRLSGTARDNKTIIFRGRLWERVFCANCGADGGLVTAEWSAHVFYLCEPCALRCGPPPGCAEANERQVRGEA
ncbi:MAG TPA: hypothetical protein VFQ82_07680 [Stellaceae bacterium]|nr:hypothetical protein [Stellaceae bacterium]